MKKFYALAVAALTTMSMSAQLFLCGEGTIGETALGWAPRTPYVLEKGTDGNYTVDITNLAGFKMSTEDCRNLPEGANDWEAFNPGALYAAITEEDLGKPVALEANSGPNISGPWMGDYHIVIAGDLSTITMTTTTPKPEGFTKVYVRGDLMGWGNDIEDKWMMSTEDGVVYTFTAEGETMIPAESFFKLADLSWQKVNYSFGEEKNEILEADGEELEWFWNVQNTAFKADFEGTIVLTLPEEFMAPAMVSCTPKNAGVADIELDANAPVEYFNLQGVRVANPENGLFIARQGSKVVKVVK